MELSATTYTDQEIDGLLTALRGRDAAARIRARKRLVEIGKPAVPELIALLADHKQLMRWEAAKTLAEIADPEAAPALIQALEDPDQDVRWVAGVAVITLGDDGLRPLLSALTKRSDSIYLFRSAHHVIAGFKSSGRSPELQRLLEALRSDEPGVMVPPAAREALERLPCQRTGVRHDVTQGGTFAAGLGRWQSSSVLAGGRTERMARLQVWHDRSLRHRRFLHRESRE